MHKKRLKNERKLKQNKKIKFTKTYLDLHYKKDNFDDIKEQIFKNVSARDRTGDHLRVRQM
jgi:hypothetical protein